MNDLVTLSEPGAAEAEAYRVLRTNLGFAQPEETLRSLVICAPAAGEGASTVAANLAVVTAQAGPRVVLVDADLRRPRQHELFGLANAAGLGGLLDGEGPLADAPLVQTSVENLLLLPAGPPPANPAELLGRPRLRQVLDRLLDRAVVVILDAPPVTAVTDAALIGAHADGVLLVLTAGRSRRDQTARARELLDKVGARLLGLALIGAEDEGLGGGY